jgi:hypothetical protein
MWAFYFSLPVAWLAGFLLLVDVNQSRAFAMLAGFPLDLFFDPFKTPVKRPHDISPYPYLGELS